MRSTYRRVYTVLHVNDCFFQIDNFVSQQPQEATVRISPRLTQNCSVVTPSSPRRQHSRRHTLERKVIEKNHVKALATPFRETPRTLIQANILAGT